MHFFTPQLYQQFNSHDEAEAEHANEAWEQAILAYKQSLETFRDRMPSPVLALSSLSLHDAEVLARAEIFPPSAPLFYQDIPFPISIWSAVAVISLQLDGEILSLFYCLWDRVQSHAAPESWPFSKLGEHWLYDEIHAQEAGKGMFYTHSILLSTGIVLDIPFSSVVIHRFPVPHRLKETTHKSA
jgi:hypothetical protein